MGRTTLYEGYSYEFFRALHEVWCCRNTPDTAWVSELDRMTDSMQMQFDPVPLSFRDIEVDNTPEGRGK